MEYLFPSPHFQSDVSLGLKWVSCRQHIYGSCFCIHSATLCLLVGAFNPFTFKVITDMYVPITIFLIVCGVLEALGKGHVSLMISLSRQLIVLVPFALIDSYFMGVAGVWLAFPVAEFVGLIFSFFVHFIFILYNM